LIHVFSRARQYRRVRRIAAKTATGETAAICERTVVSQTTQELPSENTRPNLRRMEALVAGQARPAADAAPAVVPWDAAA